MTQSFPNLEILLPLEKFTFRNNQHLHNKAVIVLGMHRSGTSAVSGIFHLAGFDLGKSVMGGNECNTKGFFENYRIMLFNEDLLLKLNVNWHSTTVVQYEWWKAASREESVRKLKALILEEFEADAPLLIKDPRICILLPVFLQAFTELGIEPFFVLVYRSPAEIAESLKKRDGFSLEKGFRIWLDHMLMAERHSRGYPRMFINYADVLSDPISPLQNLLHAFLPELAPERGISEKIRQFVEPGLRHHAFQPAPGTGEFVNGSRRIGELFIRFVQNPPTKEETDELDVFADRFYARFSTLNWPKISVVILGNEETPALEETIVSVVTRDYPNLETAMVFRGHGEERVDLVEKYRYLFTRCTVMQDQGYPGSFRKGLALSTGSWVIFLQAGDRCPGVIQ